ncbi:hypothetical protein I3F58_08260 [Streptomyces sp. MUM 203J]|uniref:DUF6286 domain-containing protein n=1 Tax=Streptomyces sp. MUM 203J TaxID=2791990 RepID=UPI001F039FCC|nr:DUF6286 domain-containing protein [Streptomyces sp. MUM 203J]MCH0539559.1 hypothetical protein [Streptomyces sp. MUM 203J]
MSGHQTAGPGPHPRHRFWSARRVPAALVALAVAAGAGLFLYDIAAVRLDRPAMRWRRALADELAVRPLDDPWLLAGAAVAVLLGGWLLVLAATPGLRGVLPMRHGTGSVRAGLHRDAVALVLRERAMEVTGVWSVRVRVRRGTALVRAQSHFRDLEEVRHDLDAALAAGVAELDLTHPPTVTVRVTRLDGGHA